MAAKLAFTVQSSVYTVNKAMRPSVIMLEIQDTSGGLVNPGQFPQLNFQLQGGTPGATLSGTNSFGFNNGIAALNQLVIDTVGSGYTIRATSNGLNPATTAPLSIVTTPNWPQVSNGEFVGGGIDALAFDNASNTLYAATKCGIWKNSNGTTGPWTEITNGITDGGFRKIAVDNNSAASPKPVYLQSFNGNLYKSSDGGSSWILLGGSFFNFSNCFELDPAIGDKLWVFSGQLRVSTDGGSNFTNVSATGLPGGFAPEMVRSGLNDLYVVTFGSSTLFRSTDLGDTFTNISGSLNPNLQNKFLDKIAIAGSTILVTTEEDGFFRSIDGGTTWTTENIGGHDSSYAVTVDPSNSNNVFVSTYDSGDAPASRGYWRSVLGGAPGSFVRIDAGLPVFGTEVTSAVFEGSGTLHVGLFGPGVFSATDAVTGTPPVWVSNRAGMPNPDVNMMGIDPAPPVGEDVVYATADRRVFKSTNGGGTWTRLLGIPSSLQFAGGIAPDGAGNVYLGSDQNILKSPDRGQTWVLSNGTAPNDIPAGVNAFLPMVDPNNDLAVYVGQFANNGSIYKSIDGGTSWQTVTNGIPANSTVLQIIAYKQGPQFGNRSQVLYAVAVDTTDNCFILRSNNEGQTWFSTNHPGATAEFGNLLALDPDGNLYYANVESGMWVLPGIGGPWQQINGGLPRNSGASSVSYASGTGATAVLFATIDHNEDSGFFVGGPYGVWKTTNGGQTWTPDTHGLYCVENEGKVFVDPKAATTAYFVESGLGVHKTMIGTPFQLAFGVQPTDSAPNANINPAPIVLVQDQGGNTVTGFAGQVSLALGNNPSGAVLTSTPQNAAGGSATFADAQVSLTGGGYTIVASAPGLASGTSQPFTVFGPPAKVAFVTQPRDTRININMTPDVRVAIQDADGNTCTNSTLPVTLSFFSSPPGAVFNAIPGQFTLTVNAVNGIATFANVFYSTAGTGYVLRAQDQGAALTAANSSSFNIFGNADHLRVALSAVSTTAGFTIPTVQVRVEDVSNNLVTDAQNVPVTIALTTGTGPLNGNPGTVNTVNGIASFTTLVINTAALDNRLTASTTQPGISNSPQSPSFIVFPGAPTRLTFSGQPVDSSAVNALVGSPNIRVDVRDSLGNLCAATNVPVYISLAPVTNGGQLTGLTVVSTSGGQAVFSPNLRIATAGTGYRLIASLKPNQSFSNLGDVDLGAAALSNAFNVNAGLGLASKLAFVAQPQNSGALPSTLNQVQVAFVDAGGNVDTSIADGTQITLSRGRGTGTLGGTLTQGTTSGVATFSDLTLDQTGSNVTLLATVAGFPQAQSQVFSISNAGTAARLEFLQQPTNATAGLGFTPSVSVRVVDTTGTLVTTGSFQVQLQIPGNFMGQTNANTNNGVVTFNGLSLTTAGTNLTLKATAPNLTSVTSQPFNITANAAAPRQLNFRRANGAPGFGYIEPTTPGGTLNPPFSVAWTDNFGNVVADNNPITMQFAFFPGSGTQLNGTVTRSDPSGVVTFNDLSINNQGQYRLQATGNSGGPVTSQFQYPTFSALLIGNVGSPQGLKFVSPLSVTAPVTATIPNVQIALTDAFGNVLPNASTTVTASIGFQSNGAVLGGQTTQGTVNGVATFNNLTIDKAGFYGMFANGPNGQFTINNLNLQIDGFRATNNGMEGGTISSLAADPQNTQIVYATTPSNGLWKTTNGGVSWTQIGMATFGNTPQGVLPSASLSQAKVLVDSTSRVFVVSGSPIGFGPNARQVFRSVDGGVTWSDLGGIGQGLVTPEGASPQLSCIAFDGLNTYYVAGSSSSTGQQVPVVYRSRDGGASWTDLSAGVQAAIGFQNDGITSIAADSLSVSGNLMVGTNSHAIVRGDSFGANWTQESLPNGSTQVSAVVWREGTSRAFAATPQSNGSSHVYTTLNAGDTWSNVGTPGLAFPVFSLAIDPTATAGVYAGTQSGNVFRFNLGTWNNLSTGLPAAGAFVGIQALAVDQNQSTLYSSASSDAFGFNGCALGVFRLPDVGAPTPTWVEANSGLKAVRIQSVAVPAGTFQTIAAGGDRMYSSSDGGDTWTPSSGLPFSAVNSVAVEPGPFVPAITPIYAAMNTFTSTAVYVSLDGGASFTQAANLPGSHARAFAFAFDTSTNPPTVIVATDRGVVTSTNRGTSWNAPANTSIPTGNYPSIAFNQTNNLLFLGANNNPGQSGVYRSSDGGANWVAINNGIGNSNMVALALDGVNKVFAADNGGQGSSGGVFLTTNADTGGPSWNQLFFNNFPNSVRALVKDPGTTGGTAVLYLGAGGAIKSKDAGATSNGIVGLMSVNAFAIHPSDSQRVYAGTFGSVSITTTGGE